MSLDDFHRMTSREIMSLKDNVRSLIHHWGEEGRYKEAVLKNVINKFLPDKYSIGTGFVIKQTEIRGQHLSSRQIDLIIYDDESPIFFREGDFVILTPDAVRGIIEVKANLQNQNMTNVLRQANENGEFIFSGRENQDELFFNGIFSYEGYQEFNLDTFAQNYLNSNLDFVDNPDFNSFKVNHVSLNENWFVKLWPEDQLPHSLYRINELSFPFFISNLTDFLSNKSVEKNNFIWFSTDKEPYLERQF